MSDTAIRVEGLGKRYRFGAHVRYKTLRDTLASAAHRVWRRPSVRAGQPSPQHADMFWALQDVSFEVKRGEVIGIIGRNGAGKSTLLKILSRITEPTAGTVDLYGRVGSLLEVGTGFHPELTGRENIYLNGAVLGMTRREIRARFDEIVAFAELERFLDTPIKYYSSGMYVRLAFSVAAHLEPEILLVDEVLAVGDAAFQQKCLGKIGGIARAGRTVVLVSHDLDAIQRMCDHCLWLQNGAVVQDGATRGVVEAYLDSLHRETKSRYETSSHDNKRAPGRTVLEEAVLIGAEGEVSSRLQFGEPFAIRMHWLHVTELKGAAYAIRVFDRNDRLIFAVNTIDKLSNLGAAGSHEVWVRFASNILVPGEYHVSIGCYIRPHTTEHAVDRCLTLVVMDIPFRPSFTFNIVGNPAVAVEAEWTCTNGAFAA